MRSFQSLALALAATASLSHAADADSDVTVLTGKTFDEFVTDNALVLAEFYAPWCGHCKALAPEYEEAATTLKEKDIALAKIDCTEEADLCAKFGVEGYPTLKVFKGPEDNKPYSGQRKAQAIISYMTKQSLPAVSVLNKETLTEFTTADKVVMVAYFDASDKTSNETFSAVAEALRDDYLFGATSDPELAAEQKAKVPSIVLYKDFDEGRDDFTEKFDKETITKFAKVAAIPLVGEVGPETYAGYMGAGIPLAYIFAETPEEREEFVKELKPVAQKYKGKVNFATIDAKAFGAHAANLNLEADKFPAFAIQETVKNTKFPFDQSKKITAKSIGAFVDDFVAGNVKPSIKSEPIPEKQEGDVKVIVAHNYEEIVMDADKDVLVEFYAPWCGHCKALAPKYEELASLYQNNPEYKDKIVIAKVDATLNDVPDEIQGFPTIKLYPAGGKDSPVDYQGSRTVEDLIVFIKENGKYKADVEAPKESAAEAPDASDLPQAAPAASQIKEKVKSAASEAAEAVKTAITDTDDDVHDEL
ncbi:MAG: protein disulfide-isomerase precursor [Vezdaea aestivalis]|nr:MAG: protein disulfide-isomerase precursor [Vezdaea aestivalis]